MKSRVFASATDAGATLAQSLLLLAALLAWTSPVFAQRASLPQAGAKPPLQANPKLKAPIEPSLPPAPDLGITIPGGVQHKLDKAERGGVATAVKICNIGAVEVDLRQLSYEVTVGNGARQESSTQRHLRSTIERQQRLAARECVPKEIEIRYSPAIAPATRLSVKAVYRGAPAEVVLGNNVAGKPLPPPTLP